MAKPAIKNNYRLHLCDGSLATSGEGKTPRPIITTFFGVWAQRVGARKGHNTKKCEEGHGCVAHWKR